jgi:hypothetical protein
MQSLYPGNDALKPAAFFTSDLGAKPSHGPYLNENNSQTANALFPFLYNGFRVSTERTAFGDTLVGLPRHSCARGSLSLAVRRASDL